MNKIIIASAKINKIKNNKKTPSLSLSNNSEKSTLSKNLNYNKKHFTIYSNNIPELFKNYKSSSINKSRNLENNIDISLLSTSKSYNRSKNDLLNSLIVKNKKNNKKLTYKINSMPIITEKAQKIKRNPHLFPERLYPLNKNNIHNNNINLEYSLSEIYGKDYEIYNKQNKNMKNEIYSFHPILSQNSIRIAEKLENSFVRLNQIPIKKLYENNTEIDLIQRKYLNLKNKKPFTLKNNNSCNHINFTNPIESLYQKGINEIKEKQLKIKRIIENKKLEYKSFSFSPQIFKRKKNSYYNKCKSNNNKEPQNRLNSYDNFYKKNIQWKQRIRSKSEIISRNNKLKELVECSFNPKITKEKLETDTSFILKNIEQINKYVKKRQDFLNKKKLMEIENEKRFFNVNYLKTNLPITNINKLKNKKTVIINDFYSQQDGKYN